MKGEHQAAVGTTALSVRMSAPFGSAAGVAKAVRRSVSGFVSERHPETVAGLAAGSL